MSFIFVKVEDCDLEQYKKDMQEAFQKGYEDDFGKTEEIILPEEDINRCGFHIVEFWNEKNPDPNMPSDFVGDGNEGMFRFEKKM